MSKKTKSAAIATVNADSISPNQTNEYLESLAPALRDVVHDVEQIFSEIQETSLRAFWRIGELINNVKSDPESYLTLAQRTAGVDAASLLIDVFAPVYTAEQLRGALSFYETYPSPGDVTRLIQLRCPNRPRWRMTVSHVQVLTQVHDPDQREGDHDVDDDQDLEHGTNLLSARKRAGAAYLISHQPGIQTGFVPTGGRTADA